MGLLSFVLLGPCGSFSTCKPVSSTLKMVLYYFLDYLSFLRFSHSLFLKFYWMGIGLFYFPCFSVMLSFSLSLFSMSWLFSVLSSFNFTYKRTLSLCAPFFHTNLFNGSSISSSLSGNLNRTYLNSFFLLKKIFRFANFLKQMCPFSL